MEDYLTPGGIFLLVLAGLFAIVVFVIVLRVLFGTFFTVRQTDVAMIARFGRFRHAAHAGLNMKMPILDQVVGSVSLRVLQLKVKVETITKDKVSLDIVIAPQFHVIPGHEKEAFYSLTDRDGQITAYVFDIVRAQVPRMDLDDVFEKKTEIEDAVRAALSEKLRPYGYEVDSTPVTEINPDETVRAAMNAINAAKRMREAAEQQGEAEKIKTIKAAEAQKEFKRLQGEGIAAERIAIAEGIKKSVELVQQAGGDTISPSEAMSTLMLTQYFDTLRSLGANSNASTIFVPHSPGGASDFMRQITDAVMVGNQAPAAHNKNGAAGEHKTAA